LADLGVPADAVDAIAAAAVVDPTAGTNPIELTVENAAALFTAAHTGTL
jgi:alcohol dehydrogenase class IV